MSTKDPRSSLFSEGEFQPGILIDREIEAAISRGNLVASDTFQSASLEASSYDIRVGRKAIVGGQGIEIDLRKNAMELEPGSYGGIISFEKLHLPPNICARIGSKRALSYDGVILLTGSIVDPGYEGYLLFGLYNASQRRVLIRTGRKICNITFERLSEAPEKQAPSDPNLIIGDFPDAFVDRMANMDVLPWMQISERVKQIENITKDILDLKAKYDDVLEPIRDLTANVDSLSKDVGSLTEQTKRISKDVENVNQMVGENSRQINQLITSLATIGGDVKAVHERTRSLEETDKAQTETLTTLRTSFGRIQILAYIFWGIVLLVLGGALTLLVSRAFH